MSQFEQAAGWLDAMAGRPFNEHASADWQIGWRMQRHAVASSTLPPATLASIDRLVEQLGQICASLARFGELATDLARSEFAARIADAPRANNAVARMAAAIAISQHEANP